MRPALFLLADGHKPLEFGRFASRAEVREMTTELRLAGLERQPGPGLRNLGPTQYVGGADGDDLFPWGADLGAPISRSKVVYTVACPPGHPDRLGEPREPPKGVVFFSGQPLLVR